MAYLEFSFSPKQEQADWFDIVLAFIEDFPFDTFQEDNGKGVAYAPIEHWNDDLKSELESTIASLPFEINFDFNNIEKQNWNQEWESQFEPVSIDSRLYIRADFHQPSTEHDMELVITPKMSFGTGHHSTTALICKYLLDADLQGKKILDAGTGSGILAILAKKKGAAEAEAFDIEDWCVENTVENAANNNVSIEHVFQGTILNASFTEVDVLIANINKNILTQEMAEYAKRIKNNGQLILSGFYTQDNQDLIEKAAEYNLDLQFSDDLNNWSCLIFKKNL